MREWTGGGSVGGRPHPLKIEFSSGNFGFDEGYGLAALASALRRLTGKYSGGRNINPISRAMSVSEFTR